MAPKLIDPSPQMAGSEPVLKLVDVGQGQTVKVLRIASDDVQLRQRLQSMGVVKGAEIVVNHTAPLGDPRIYVIKGYQVALRNSEAQCIQVTP